MNQGEETSHLMGYLVSRVEERIVEYVLRGTGVTHTHINIDQLDKAVRENFYCRCRTVFESQEQVDEANDNWDWLEEAINVGSSLYCTVETLRLWRPLVDLNLTREGAYERLRTAQSDQEEHKNIGLRILKVLDFLEIN